MATVRPLLAKILTQRDTDLYAVLMSDDVLDSAQSSCECWWAALIEIFSVYTFGFDIRKRNDWIPFFKRCVVSVNVLSIVSWMSWLCKHSVFINHVWISCHVIIALIKWTFLIQSKTGFPHILVCLDQFCQSIWLKSLLLIVWCWTLSRFPGIKGVRSLSVIVDIIVNSRRSSCRAALSWW